MCVIVPLRKKSRKTTIFIKILTHGLKINTFVFAKIDQTPMKCSKLFDYLTVNKQTIIFNRTKDLE